jgi:hypothetical protein
MATASKILPSDLSRGLEPRSVTEEPNRLSTKPVPGQASSPPAAVATIRPANLKHWIGALPYANRGAVLRSLNEELSLLNAAAVKPSVRFELLELHAGAYVRLLNSLIQQEGSGGVAALKQHRVFAETARSLTLRVADGYKLIIDGTGPKKSSLFAKRRSDIAAIQRAILFLCYSLNHFYDQYLPTEPRVWIELAKLYGLARERGALDRSGSRNDHRREFGKPISHLYKLALLTGLADPYHHGPGEVWKMFELLGECADAADLGPEPPSVGPEGIFVIDPGGVERAKPLEFEASGGVAKGYYLDTNATSALLQKMRDEVEQGNRDAFRTTRSKRQAVSILNRVLRSLKEPAQRSNDRTPIAKPVQLAVGIAATQRLIGGPIAGGAQATFTAGTDVVTQGAESKNEEVAVLKMIDPRSGGTVDVGVDIDTRKGGIGRKKDGGADGPDEASIMANYGTEPWQVTNKSPRGIGIMRQDAPQTFLCVGEIVSIATKKRAPAIGLVRWYTVDESGIYRAGIEIIGKRADSIAVRAAKDEGNPGAARPALALPFFGADEKVATLAAPPGTFSEGRVLIVDSPGSDARVRVQMKSLIDATPSCERFTYRVT